MESGNLLTGDSDFITFRRPTEWAKKHFAERMHRKIQPSGSDHIPRLSMEKKLGKRIIVQAGLQHWHRWQHSCEKEALRLFKKASIFARDKSKKPGICHQLGWILGFILLWYLNTTPTYTSCKKNLVYYFEVCHLDVLYTTTESFYLCKG